MGTWNGELGSGGQRRETRLRPMGYAVAGKPSFALWATEGRPNPGRKAERKTNPILANVAGSRYLTME